MRVILNRSFTLGQKTGVGHYTAQLLRCLRAQVRPGEKVSAFPSGWAWRIGQALSRPLLARGEKSAGPAGAEEGRTSWWRGLRNQTFLALRGLNRAYLTHSLQKRVAHHGCDLYHEPNTIPLPCDLPTLATIHDLSLLFHPHWHPPGRARSFEKNLPALQQCRHFLADSEFTRQQAIRTFNLPSERVTRVYIGIRPELRPLPSEETARRLRALGLSPGYLLYVGTIEPRKNLLTLLQAYCALPDNIRRRGPLVLAGGWGWSSAAVADFFHSRARALGVIQLGYVADEHLPALYNGARALVYPSFYEGFGLPPVEMLACGGAVLASTAEAIVEIVGGQAHLIDPLDVDGWRRDMTRFWIDDDWWQSLRAGALERARPFTWERCAEETLRVYRQLCQKSSDLPAGTRAA